MSDPVTDPDRLAEIKEAFPSDRLDWIEEVLGLGLAEQILWLIGEVERLRKEKILLKRVVEHLRGRLRELERTGSPDGDKACPVCYADANHDGPLHHDPDCWLAAELRST